MSLAIWQSEPTQLNLPTSALAARLPAQRCGDPLGLGIVRPAAPADPDALNAAGARDLLSGTDQATLDKEILDSGYLTPKHVRSLIAENCTREQLESGGLDPEFLILDEPAAGLDPKARIEFKHLVRLLAEEGKTLFISSHILSELGEMCDTMLFIDAGRIVHHGSAESLRSDGARGALVDVRVAGETEPVLQWIAVNPGVELVEATRLGARIRVLMDSPDAMAATLRKMIQDGLPVTEFHKEERKLEEAFVDILHKVGGAVPPVPAHLSVE